MSPEEMRMPQRFSMARAYIATYKEGVEDKAAFIEKVKREYGDATQYILSGSTAGILRELLKEVGRSIYICPVSARRQQFMLPMMRHAGTGGAISRYRLHSS